MIAHWNTETTVSWSLLLSTQILANLISISRCFVNARRMRVPVKVLVNVIPTRDQQTNNFSLLPSHESASQRSLKTERETRRKSGTGEPTMSVSLPSSLLVSLSLPAFPAMDDDSVRLLLILIHLISISSQFSNFCVFYRKRCATASYVRCPSTSATWASTRVERAPCFTS